MAISTPAQKPARRGQQHPVDVHHDRGLPRAVRRILGGCPPRESSPSRPVRRGAGRARAWATRCVSLNGQVPRDVIEWRLLADDAELELEVRRGGLEHPRRRDQAGRRAARRRGVVGAVRPGAHVRQPLRVLLHLPAAARACGRSLYLKDDDYRLSFLYGNFTTLTRFTEADLERVLIEGLSPLQRQHPRHRPRRPRGACCATAGAPPACAGCGPCSTTASPSTARSCVPGRQRRRRPGGHAGRRARPVPRAGRRCASCPSACPASTPSPTCGPTPGPRRRRWSTPSTTGRRSTSTLLGRRLVHAADEYYLLAGRPFPAADAYEGFPMHEDGIGMARTFEQELLGRVATRRPACRAASSPGSTARRPRATGRPATRRPTPRSCARNRAIARTAHAATGRPVGILTGDVRRPGAAPARSTGSAATTCASSPSPTSSSAATPRVTGLMVGADLARGAGRRAGRPPLPAARRLPVGGPLPRRHHARPTCPARSRSSPPTASPCAEALAIDEHPRRRRRRAAQRRQEHAGEPHRRQAGRDRRGPAPASPATARRSRPSGWACPSCWSTPAAGCPAARDLEAKVSRQVEKAVRGADVVLFLVDASVGVTEEDAGVAEWLRRTGKPVLLVANKADNDRRERETWEFLVARPRRAVAASARSTAAAPATCSTSWSPGFPTTTRDADGDAGDADGEPCPTSRPWPSSGGPTWARAPCSTG